MLSVKGVTHWSIPVNDLEESERFYRDLLGFEYKGRLGNARMACVGAGDHNILLCQRDKPVSRPIDEDTGTHHSFTVESSVLEEACKLFPEKGVPITDLVYREKGFFTGRELYFLDPSGNRLELRDPTWKPGMPTPTHEEIARTVTA
ncbi:MAG TPA: VOC family protein [Dehalococcoidia bacterium]|nr:VOC family protein [Dehalococcoidia bacterium]